MKHNEEISFEDFLSNLESIEESYILAIRYKLKPDTLFWKGHHQN